MDMEVHVFLKQGIWVLTGAFCVSGTNLTHVGGDFSR